MNYFSWLILLLVFALGYQIFSSIRKGFKARKHVVDSNWKNPNENHPLVSVLVPAWKEGVVLKDCLSSLLSVQYQNFEVIVIAGGNDGTYELAKEFCKEHKNFQVVEQEPLGKNHALNQGFSIANGEIIVILDADSNVSEYWLESLVNPLHAEFQASTGKAFPRRRTPISLNEFMERLSAYEVHHQVTLQGSASIAICRDVIDKIGGFPEDVFVGVDWDLDSRCKTMGVKRSYCSEATIVTERPATWQEFWVNEVRWRSAHLRSILRMRQSFLSTPKQAINSLYIYIFSWFLLFFGIFALIGTIIGQYPGAFLWLIIMIWTLIRRVNLSIEVATYTQDLHYLSYFWVAPITLLMTFAAIIQATVSINNQPKQFKGARPNLLN